MRLSKLKQEIDRQLAENGDNEVFISVDVSTCDEDATHRIFANPVSVCNHGDIGYAILSEMTEDNGEGAKK